MNRTKQINMHYYVETDLPRSMSRVKLIKNQTETNRWTNKRPDKKQEDNQLNKQTDNSTSNGPTMFSTEGWELISGKVLDGYRDTWFVQLNYLLLSFFWQSWWDPVRLTGR